MFKAGLNATVALFALVIAGTPALAAEADAPAPEPAPPRSSAAEPAGRAEIVVTAQRREEAIQKVPVAVTVFSAEDRDRLGIRSIQDFSNVTPGLSFNAQLDRLSIRGVGRLTNIIGSDPGVAVYNDGVYTASNAEASKTPMFVQSVQILRGPQGTLFGRNSVGGAINVTSARPTDTYTGELRFTADKYGGAIAEGFVAGPLFDSVKTRLSVQYGPRPLGEAFRNVGGGGDQGSLKRFLVEGQLQFDIAEDTDLWIKYSHAEWDHERYGQANLVTPYATATFFPSGALTPNAGFNYAVANPGVVDVRTINTNTTGEDRLSRNHNVVVNFRMPLSDNVQLKYVGGYSQYVYTLFTDLDLTGNGKQTANFGSKYGAFTYNPTYIQRYIEDKDYFSNEITLSNRGGGDRFNWVLGAYQYREHFFQPIDWYVGGDGSDNMAIAIAVPLCVNAAFAPQPGCAANPQRSFYSGTGKLSIDSYAGFGQADYKLTDRLKVTAGLRYSSDRKTGTETYRLINYNPVGAAYCTLAPFGVIGFGNCGPLTAAADITTFVLQLPGSGPQQRTLRRTFSGWSWRLGADYQINPDVLLYASYNRGLKAGGFNLGSYAASPVVDNEKVDAYEIGLKTRPSSGTTLNFTAFYYDYKDAQVPITVPFAPTLGLTTTNFFNIDKSRSIGFEIESHWNVTDRLELTGTYSYLDATIRRAPQLFDDPNLPGTVLVDLAGKRSPTTSKHKVYLGALYDQPVGGGHVLFAASYAHRSDAFYDVFNSPSGRAPGWDQVDARITFVDPSRRFTLIAYARNLFNTLGYVGATGSNGTGAAGFGQIYAYNPPRQIGGEIHVRF